MGIPQIIIIVIYAIGLGIAICEHGTPKTGVNNFWLTLWSAITELSLFWWGGFFG